MKIVATTYNTYICEVSKDEMHALTGQDESYSTFRFKPSMIVNVLPLKRHIDAMKYTIDQRRSAAQALRAAATVIETVPEAFTEPQQPEAAP